MQIKTLIAAIALSVLPTSGFAQTSPPKQDCAPTQTKPNDPNGLKTTGSDKPLTEKLAETGGVLCPPSTGDTDIRVPAPTTGSNMPVVPPPGSSGGDSTVKPK